MTFLLGLAFRNLMRNLRRTAITSVSVIAGVLVLIVGQGFVDGLDENVIRAQEDALSGELMLQPEGYPDDGLTLPLDLARPVDDGLKGALSAPGVEDWAPRIFAFGRLVSGADSVRARLMGYDPERDPRVFDRSSWELEGAWPASPTEVVLGRGLATLLELKPGAMVAVEARTRAGAINASQFTVAGVLRTRTPALDVATVWMPMDTADELLRTEGARSVIAVRLEGGRPAADAAKGSIRAPGWAGKTATESVADILEINTIRRRALSFIVFILMAISATGIANTVIMATYERVREIGTLRAMGMGPMAVRALFLLEGAATGLVAGALGATLGGWIVAHFAAAGIDISQAPEMGEIPVSTILYLHFSWTPVLGALGFGAAVAVLASIYPAHLAASLNPADAVRAH